MRDTRFYESIEKFVITEDCFQNNDVSFIDKDGLQHYLENKEYMTYLSLITEVIAKGHTIKLEQFEYFTNNPENELFNLLSKLYNTVDITAHAFYNQENSGTFDIHTDPVDVWIQCWAGVKHLEVDGKEVVLYPHEVTHIPANTPHRALNTEKALMVSYGIHDTETLNSLR